MIKAILFDFWGTLAHTGEKRLSKKLKAILGKQKGTDFIKCYEEATMKRVCPGRAPRFGPVHDPVQRLPRSRLPMPRPPGACRKRQPRHSPAWKPRRWFRGEPLGEW